MSKEGAIKTLFVIVAVLYMTGCAFIGRDELKQDEPTDRIIYQITYSVTGNVDSVDITFENKHGGTSQKKGVAIPWTYHFNREAGESVSISVQNYTDRGSISVVIFRNGEIYRMSSCSGPYCIARAYGIL